jgi:hypothetical protein
MNSVNTNKIREKFFGINQTPSFLRLNPISPTTIWRAELRDAGTTYTPFIIPVSQSSTLQNSTFIPAILRVSASLRFNLQTHLSAPKSHLPDNNLEELCDAGTTNTPFIIPVS